MRAAARQRAARLAMAALGLCGALAGSAAELTIERLFDDPPLSGPRARSVRVAPSGDRVLFLRGRDDDQFQLDLWEVALGGGDATPHRLLDSRRLLPEEHLSDEETARRERERTAAYHGILDFQWSPDGRRLLVPLGGDLYLVELPAGADPALEPAITRLPLGHHDLIDPKISPRGRYVSYLYRQNLYVYDLQARRERALTRDGGGAVHNAEAEFIAQEEFAQTSGYWWAPDDTRIVFKRFDESRVPVVKRMQTYARGVETVEQRYPAAGQANAALRLGVLAPDGRTPVRWLDLGADADLYLPRVDWLPDARRVAVQRLSRDQKTLDLLFIDTRSGAARQVLHETSPAWIEVHDDLRFLQGEPAFVWASDRSGYKQLYLYDLDGRLLRPLTHGDWDVDEVLLLDESARRLVFASNRERIEDRQIYAADLDGDAPPRRLSAADGWHAADFGCGGERKFGCRAGYYVDTWSDVDTPPQVAVRALDGTRVAWIEANALDEHHPYAPYRAQHVQPEFGQIAAEDGQALHYRLTRPADAQPGRRYPVLLSFYGGPTAQEAVNAWPRELFDQYLAQHGIAVFTLDNRGTARRGRRFADVLLGRLGRAEVADQLAGVRWLARQEWVDAAHIGCFGWSYGGYLSLMLLAHAGQSLAAGISVAPVTDWQLYDTGYTERYLGTPAGNADGYRRSAVFDALPGLQAPLLLIHGMADDNVLFTNSTSLMAALQGQGTQFDLMTYPGGKHGLSTPAMHKHAFRAMARFLQRHLQGAPR
jgi:dipeptidyl-peptidase-4